MIRVALLLVLVIGFSGSMTSFADNAYFVSVKGKRCDVQVLKTESLTFSTSEKAFSSGVTITILIENVSAITLNKTDQASKSKGRKFDIEMVDGTQLRDGYLWPNNDGQGGTSFFGPHQGQLIGVSKRGDCFIKMNDLRHADFRTLHRPTASQVPSNGFSATIKSRQGLTARIHNVEFRADEFLPCGDGVSCSHVHSMHFLPIEHEEILKLTPFAELQSVQFSGETIRYSGLDRNFRQQPAVTLRHRDGRTYHAELTSWGERDRALRFNGQTRYGYLTVYINSLDRITFEESPKINFEGLQHSDTGIPPALLSRNTLCVHTQQRRTIGFQKASFFELDGGYRWPERNTDLTVTAGNTTKTIRLNDLTQVNMLHLGYSRRAEKRVRLFLTSGTHVDALIAGNLWIGGDTEQYGRTRMHISKVKTVDVSGCPPHSAASAHPVRVDSKAIAERLLAPYATCEQPDQDQLNALTHAVETLAQQQGEPDAPPEFSEALDQLKQGNTKAAEAIFEARVKRQEADVKETARALRHLGALAAMREMEKALQAYRRSVVLDPENAEGWTQLGHLHQRVGHLDEAIQAYEQVRRLSELAQNQVGMALAYSSMGVVYTLRGELDRAEQLHRQALALEEARNRREGMARDYSNLGNIYRIRRKLDQAEQLYGKALDQEKSLDRLAGIACAFGNLSLVFGIQGHWPQSALLTRQALAIYEGLGSMKGMARAYVTLGHGHRMRGELDQAEVMYRQAFALSMGLGHKQGLARDYLNLGRMFSRRKELDQAEASYRKALTLHEKLGHKEGLANSYGHLGVLYLMRGKFDQAEQMYRKALALYQALGVTREVESIKGTLKSLRVPN